MNLRCNEFIDGLFCVLVEKFKNEDDERNLLNVELTVFDGILRPFERKKKKYKFHFTTILIELKTLETLDTRAHVRATEKHKTIIKKISLSFSFEDFDDDENAFMMKKPNLL